MPEELRGLNDTTRLSPRGDALMLVRGWDLVLVNAATGREIRTHPCQAEVSSFSWDFNGTRVAISLRDNSLTVLELATGAFRQLSGRVANAWVRPFSPDGRRLVTAGVDGTSQLWLRIIE